MADKRKGVGSGKVQKAFKENGVNSRIELYNLRASRVGCTYLGDENAGSDDLTSWECSKGHVFEAIPNKIQQGQGCPFCNSRNDMKCVLLRNNCKNLDEYGHKIALENPNNIKYIGGFINTKTKAEWECSKGHVFQCRPNNIRQGQGCHYCNSSYMEYVLFRNNCKTVDEYGHKLATENPNGIKYIGGFVGAKIKAEWECSKGHRWEAVPHNIKAGYGCPACAKCISKKEQALFLEVKKLYPEAINNNRQLLKNTRYELDIFVPSLRKAVEFDGTYWHSRPTAITRDAHKDSLCTEAGITLLRIKESDWDIDKDTVIKNVLHFLKA
jgi:very-short-patch-repair endonuclease